MHIVCGTHGRTLLQPTNNFALSRSIFITVALTHADYMEAASQCPAPVRSL